MLWRNTRLPKKAKCFNLKGWGVYILHSVYQFSKISMGMNDQGLVC